MKKIIYTLAIVFMTAIIGCVDREYDKPPIPEIPTGNVLTISDLYNIYNDSGEYKFVEDYSVYAVVSMAEESGNLYKSVYVQDNEKGINLHLLNPGGLYQGDSIRIYLKGLIVSEYNGILQLDSVDVDKNIVKQATDVNVEPIEVNSLSQLNDNMLCKLVKINNVQFIFTDTSKTFADHINRISENRTLEDCDENTLIVRTSGYADFASYSVPDGNGSLVGIFSKYGSDYQLYIRSYAEVNMNGERCGRAVYLYQDFSEGLTTGGWTIVNVTGNVNWEYETQYGNPAPCAVISNYNAGSHTECETWFVSPVVDLSNAVSPVLNFDNAYKYTGAPLSVYVSTDYDGSGDVSNGNWIQLNNINLSTGNFVWTNSGDIDMSAYKTSSVYVAFVYVGSSTDGSTWEIDNIFIEDNTNN